MLQQASLRIVQSLFAEGVYVRVRAAILRDVPIL